MMLLRTSRIALLALLLALTACGFQLRNTTGLAFKNLYMQGSKLTINKNLTRSLQVNGVTVVDNPEKAELFLEMLSEQREQKILSLSGSGKVREFEVIYRVTFRLRNPTSEIWGPVQAVENRRDFSYDDSQLLAKQLEEERMLEDMRNAAAREIMRLLVVQKPKDGA
jgi:LPS-assembly lipoprotein